MAASQMQVQVRRPAGSDRIILLSGRTTEYSIEPRGEYVFGVVGEQPMRSRRGRDRRVAVPGQLVAWDPSTAHSGWAATGQPWSSRLMVVETADLAALAEDPEGDPLADVAFPQPVITDPALVRSFVRLHRALGSTATALESDDLLTEWLPQLIGRWSARPRPRPSASPYDDRAIRIALAMMADNATQNLRLEEIAAAAGITKFRLIRLCRQRTGLTPHALQVAHRIRIARRLLEAGHTVVDTAVATGFADQSHLHRHFRRTLGMTPADYRQRLRS